MATQTEDQFAGRAWPVLGPVPSITTPITPMAMIERALADGKTGPETLAHLMVLHRDWQADRARVAYEEAMSQARAEIPLIPKTKQVGFDSKKAGAARTDYKHESLDDVVGICVPILTKHGLRPSFRTEVQNGLVVVTCRITHALGHFEETALPAQPDNSGNKNSIQAIGSTVTYLQRYTMKAILGLAAAEDKDGGQPRQEDLLIVNQQADDLFHRLTTAGADIPGFCGIFKIEKIGDLRESQYAEADRLVRVKEKKAKEKVNGA